MSPAQKWDDSRDMKNYQLLQQKYVLNTYPDRSATLTRGENVYLYEQSGEKYLDMMSNYGVSIFGYGHPQIQRRLSEQLMRLTTLHGSFNSDTRAEAAQILIERCGRGLEKVYFANSGTEAIEAALKFAVLATGKKKFISCYGCFHGKTLGALSATQEGNYRAAFEPLLWDFRPVAYSDPGQLEGAIDEGTAAFLVEPIQGEGGINIPDPGYLKCAKDICAQHGVLMILDEIQTGVGRTGSFLASEEEIDEFDILCLGKGLAGGIPAGATLVSGQVAEKIPRTVHTSTLGGNPLAAAGIVAVCDALDEGMLKHIREIGAYFQMRLRDLVSSSIIQVRGKGLMLGIEVSGRRSEILQRLQMEKVLAIPASESIVRFLPPYTIEKEHVDQAVEALQRILRDIEAGREMRARR